MNNMQTNWELTAHNRVSAQPVKQMCILVSLYAMLSPNLFTYGFNAVKRHKKLKMCVNDTQNVPLLLKKHLVFVEVTHS